MMKLYFILSVCLGIGSSSAQPWTQTCPVVYEKGWCSPEESKSACWSPGESDFDCPNNGICCFNGCSNQCGIPTPYTPVEVPATLAPPVTTTTAAPLCTTVLVDRSETVQHEMCAENPGPEVCHSVWEDQCKDDCKNVEKPEEVCTPESKWVENKVCKYVTKTQTCPVVHSKDWCSPEEYKSTCWTPGEPDYDCPNNGVCCFNGCSNRCGIPVCKPVCTAVEKKECQPGQPGPDVCHSVWEDKCKEDCKNVDKSEEVCTPESKWVEDKVCKNVSKNDWVCNPVCNAVERKECKPGQPGPDVCHSIWEDKCKEECKNIDKQEEVCNTVWDQVCTDKPCYPITEMVDKTEKECVTHPEECHTVPEQVCKNVTETVCEAPAHTATNVCHMVWMSGGECGREIVCEKEWGKECKTIHQKWKRSLKWKAAKKEKKICWPAKVEKCFWAPKNCQKEVCKQEAVSPVCHDIVKPSCSLVDREECVPAREMCVDVTKQVPVQSTKHCPMPPQQDCHEVENKVCKNVTKTDWVCNPVCSAVERKECQPGQPGPDVCHSVWEDQCKDECKDVQKQEEVCTSEWNEVQNTVCKNVIKTDWVCNPVCNAVERKECQPGQPGPDVCHSVWEDQCKDECNDVEKPEEVCTSEWNQVQNTVCKVVQKSDWVCTPTCKAVERKDCQPGKPVKNCWKVPKTVTYKVPKKVCSPKW